MKTKDKILQTACDMFNATNTQAATTNHIAKKMGISPGNLHYHFKNREEIILNLYRHMRSELTLKSDSLPKTLQELIEHQKVIFKVLWKYRFFQRELLFLLSRDATLKNEYINDNIAHRSRIIKTLQNFSQNEIIVSKYTNVIEHLADSILMTFQFWTPFIEAQDKPLNEYNIELAIIHTREILRPYLSESSLKLVSKLET